MSEFQAWLLATAAVGVLVLLVRLESANRKLDTLLTSTDPATLDRLRAQLKTSGDALDATIKANQPK